MNNYKKESSNNTTLIFMNSLIFSSCELYFIKRIQSTFEETGHQHNNKSGKK